MEVVMNNKLIKPVYHGHTIRYYILRAVAALQLFFPYTVGSNIKVGGSNRLMVGSNTWLMVGSNKKHGKETGWITSIFVILCIPFVISFPYRLNKLL